MLKNRKLNRSTTRHRNSIAERKRKWIKLAIQENGYSYDTAGRLIQQTMPNGDTVSYQLDANGNRTQLIYPDGYYAEYAYDQLNRLTSISLNGSTSPTVQFEYDELSRRTQMTYDSGCVTNYAYALNNDMNSLQHSFVGSEVTFSYLYNNVHQIVGLSADDSTFLWEPSASSTVTYATANNLNQYPSVGGTAYSYNDNGCLTGGPQSATFDSLSRITQIVSGSTTNNYWTDPLNRQARKSVNGTDTNYLYDGNQLIATYDDSGDLISRFIVGDGIDEHFINITGSGNVYLHTDRTGSVIAETDASGAVLNKFAFSPFGESSSVSASNFGYTGQRYDSEIGLYNYKMRYYSPAIGRFLQPDPLGYSTGELNLYSYVGNDGMNLTDPLGLQAVCSPQSNQQPKTATVTGSSPATMTPLQGSVSEPSYNKPVWLWTPQDAGDAYQDIRRQGSASIDPLNPTPLQKQFAAYLATGLPVANVTPTVQLGTYTTFPNDPGMANVQTPTNVPTPPTTYVNMGGNNNETLRGEADRVIGDPGKGI